MGTYQYTENCGASLSLSKIIYIHVLFCCVAAGNDPYSQFLSDEEQVEYLARWKKEHGYK